MKRKSKKVKTVQQTIPYLRVDFNSKLIETSKGIFSTTIKFEDINYSIAREHDKNIIFNDYVRLLNYFTEDNSIQITLNNKVKDMEVFEEELLLKNKGDSIDYLRDDYNSILKNNVSLGKSNMVKEMYFTISVKAKDFKVAKIKLEKVQKEVINNLKKIGSKAKVMSIEERLESLHDFFNPDEVGEFMLDKKSINNRGEGTKDTIAPDSFYFSKSYFKIGEKFARALFVKNLPNTLSDKFITEIMETNKTMMLTINIDAMDNDKTIKLIQRQITGMRANKIEFQKKSIESGYIDSYIPYELKASLEDAEDLLIECTKKNQKLFLVSILILHEADTLEELKEDTDILKRIATKNLCKIGNLIYQQEEGLKSILPLGVNKLEVDRTLTSDATAILMPFNSQEMHVRNGCCYGTNATSGNVILLDRRKLKNGNSWILGTPGSGKSFSAKAEFVDIALKGDCDIIIIDPDDDFGNLTKLMNGLVVDVSLNSDSFINPLDLNSEYAGDGGDPLLLKSEFVLSLFENLVLASGGLLPVQKTIIDRCVRKVYMEYITHNYDDKYIPTLLDFQEILEEQPEREAKDLALSAEMYSRGSFDLFAHKTNIDLTDNHIVCFNIQNLGAGLKSMGMLIILDYIWNKITRNRKLKRNTYVYIDECYLLFENEISANFLYKLYKRSRKYGCLITSITQNISDLLQSDTATTMLSNSEFIQLFNQSPNDRARLAEILDISDTQLSFITGVDPGNGLLICGDNAIIPFNNQFPEKSILYKYMTTKLDEAL